MSKVRPEKVKRMTSLTALESNAIGDGDRLKRKVAVIPKRVPKRKKRKEKSGGAAEYPRPFVRDTTAGIPAQMRLAVKHP